MSITVELTCALDDLIRHFLRDLYYKVKEEKRDVRIKRVLRGRFGRMHERKKVGEECRPSIEICCEEKKSQCMGEFIA
jgi:hypothetical protein